jgi:hypothetical protein
MAHSGASSIGVPVDLRDVSSTRSLKSQSIFLKASRLLKHRGKHCVSKIYKI